MFSDRIKLLLISICMSIPCFSQVQNATLITKSNIYFHFSTASLMESSSMPLDSILSLLNIGGFTRMVITVNFSARYISDGALKLSQERAKTLQQYFSQKLKELDSKIEIVGIGLGSSAPIIPLEVQKYFTVEKQWHAAEYLNNRICFILLK